MSKQTDAETPAKGGYRKGLDKKEIMKSMTKEDWKRISEQKKFESFTKGSVTAMVALQNDSLRRIRDEKTDNVEQRVNNIINLKSVISRKEGQIESGVITDELKEGVLMNKDELLFEINGSKRMIKREIIDICVDLGKLREIVGCHDFVGNVIITEEEYDSFVESTDDYLSSIDLNLFDPPIREFHKRECDV